MRVRAYDENGDYRFGGLNQFLVDTPEAVAQAIQSRLALWTGEWFLDTGEGTDFNGSILGYGTAAVRDLVIQDRILGTPGVREIIDYSSDVDERARRLKVSATVDTLYGQVSFTSR